MCLILKPPPHTNLSKEGEKGVGGGVIPPPLPTSWFLKSRTNLNILGSEMDNLRQGGGILGIYY